MNVGHFGELNLKPQRCNLVEGSNYSGALISDVIRLATVRRNNTRIVWTLHFVGLDRH